MGPQPAQSQVEPRRRRKVSEPIDWPSYDKALVQRGNITIWLSDDAVRAWHPEHGGKRGGQYDYSDLAIETSLTIRLVFKQALRQTEGFVQCLIGMMNLDIKAPDHTTLCRRSKTVRVGPIMPTVAIQVSYDFHFETETLPATHIFMFGTRVGADIDP